MKENYIERRVSVREKNCREEGRRRKRDKGEGKIRTDKDRGMKWKQRRGEERRKRMRLL